jgi:phage terminase large subunit
MMTMHQSGLKPSPASLSNLEIQTAEVFLPLLTPARYKGAHGGRGSGKSHFFAEFVVEEHLRIPGCRTVCVREVLKSLKQSAKLLIEDKIQALGVGAQFDVQNDRIKTPGGGLIIFEGMQDHSAETIKSLEGFDRCWVEEAQSLSARSLSMLRPTIRKPESEIWFSWNPTRKKDAVDDFLRVLKPAGAVVVQANWKDNPWFPKVLEDERQRDLTHYPERYDHIWEGDYAKAFEGAYFASLLGAAKREGRIGRVTADPLLPLRAFIDIGGAGAQADAFTIWIVQWVAQEIRVLDYYEAMGQVLGEHVAWLRSRGYQKAIIHLPHDGVNTNNITGKQYKDHFRDADFDVPPPLPNQGIGAKSMRIEAVRRIMPKCWFNELTTEPGRDALGFYHEKKDETRGIGLGPDHDWSSHAADAFGLMAVCYEEPSRKRAFSRKIEYPNVGVA